MSRLTIPEPEIRLYEDGLEGRDLLERKATSDALSDLVDRIAEPMVIALDGGWGSGKSFFLKCWVGEHLKREGNTTQTVYFDAFANDFMDEPLVSLMACLLERFEELGPKEKSKLDKAKKIAWKLGPAGLRIAASMATFGATNHLDDLGDAAAEAVGKEVEKSSDSFWREAQERQGVMEQFRQALGALTVGADGATRKLVIVVDELDRCRPDYALALLEIIKHFFAVDHVHFVLGVNQRELENSVKARYGAGINAGLYLQKFVTLTMGLPETSSGYGSKKLVMTYFETNQTLTNLSDNQFDMMSYCIEAFKLQEDISLRAIQRLLAVLQITTIPNKSGFPGDKEERDVIICLCVLKAWNLPVYRKALSGNITLEDLKTVYQMREQTDEYGHDFSAALFHGWQYFLEPEEYYRRFPDPRQQVAPARSKKIRELQALIQEHLEVFRLPDASQS